MKIKGAFFVFAFVGFVFSACAQNNKTEMVKQMLLLEGALLKGDKQKVASFFNFPVADESIKLKVEFDGEKEISIDKLDKATFLKYYQSIVTPDLLELFRQLDFSQLKSKDEIARTNIPKSRTDFCTYTYEASIKGQELEISFLLNTRDDITIGEEDFCPEYAEFWTFEMVNGKLKFKGIGFAG